jgi:hypothetical protein
VSLVKDTGGRDQLSSMEISFGTCVVKGREFFYSLIPNSERRR